MQTTQDQMDAYIGYCAIDRGVHRAERLLIGRLLIDPEQVGSVRTKIAPADLDEKLNQNLLAAIYGMQTEGQTATKHEIISAWGDYDVDNRLRLSGYVTGCIGEALTDIIEPIDGLVQAVSNQAKRRLLESAAHTLQLATDGKRSVTEIGRSAIDQIHSILTDVGDGERKLLTAPNLAQAGLASLAGNAKIGPSTGFVDLDRIVGGGWPLAQLSIVAGRPGMGKSAFATSAALNAAKAGAGVLVFSLEMTGEQIGARLLTDLAFTSLDPVRYQRRNEGLSSRHQDLVKQAMGRLEGLSIQVCDRSGITVEDIAVLARMHAAEMKNRGKSLDLVLVDHIGLIMPTDAYRGNRVREVAEATQGLASLAKRLDIPVVGLCQLNRAVEGRENKRATLSDLRDSGAIEEDASLVLMLYRPAYYLERERFDDRDKEAARQEALSTCINRLEIGIEKNRNGPPGRVDLFVDIGANAVRNASFGGR
jgi:replicative DNA helicase